MIFIDDCQLEYIIVRLYNMSEVTLQIIHNYFLGNIQSAGKPKNVYEDPEVIIPYLLNCLLTEYPYVTEEDVIDTWTTYSFKKSLIEKYITRLYSEAVEDYENPYRYIAFGRAREQIMKLKVPIFSSEQAEKMKYIGPKIGKIINEILKNGLPVEENNVVDDKKVIIRLFTNIWGVGPVKAHNLYDMGYRNINDVIEADAKNNILTRQQKIGLKYYHDFLQRIPRDEISQTEKFVKGVVAKLNKKATAQVVGSYRRGKENSGDIDVLVSVPKGVDQGSFLQSIITSLTEQGLIHEILSLGHEKFLGAGRLPGYTTMRRIDILCIPESTYPAALLYFTGSGEFNKMMRQKAITLGYKLNERGLFRDNILIPAATEEDIFKLLNMKFVLPQNRE